jgi:hypothetical protein
MRLDLENYGQRLEKYVESFYVNGFFDKLVLIVREKDDRLKKFVLIILKNCLYPKETHDLNMVSVIMISYN